MFCWFDINIKCCRWCVWCVCVVVVLQGWAAATGGGTVVIPSWTTAAAPPPAGGEEPAGPWPPPCSSACLSLAVQETQTQGHNGVCAMILLQYVIPCKLYSMLSLNFLAYFVPLKPPFFCHPLKPSSLCILYVWYELDGKQSNTQYAPNRYRLNMSWFL